MNKPSLPKFLNVWHRLPEYLRTLQLNVQALDINKTSIISSNLTTQNISSGSLSVGKIYSISDLNIGDDFSNLGFIETNSLFIATGTTPTNWTNGTEVIQYDITILEVFNNIDTSMVVEPYIENNSLYLLLTITNNLFIEDKLFTINSPYVYLNSNKILLDLNKKIKIEIYN